MSWDTNENEEFLFEEEGNERGDCDYCEDTYCESHPEYECEEEESYPTREPVWVKMDAKWDANPPEWDTDNGGWNSNVPVPANNVFNNNRVVPAYPAPVAPVAPVANGLPEMHIPATSALPAPAGSLADYGGNDRW